MPLVVNRPSSSVASGSQACDPTAHPHRLALDELSLHSSDLAPTGIEAGFYSPVSTGVLCLSEKSRGSCRNYPLSVRCRTFYRTRYTRNSLSNHYIENLRTNQEEFISQTVFSGACTFEAPRPADQLAAFHRTTVP